MSDSEYQQHTSTRFGQGNGSFDLYAEITGQIISMLDRGVVPWRSPILGQGRGGLPKNFQSKKPYRGVNVFLLAFVAHIRGFQSTFWLSFRQAQQVGGCVKKGEKSTMVIFWKKYEVEDKQTGEKKEIPIIRFFRVFNVAQCDGIAEPDVAPFTPTDFQPIQEAEKILKGYADGPTVTYGGTRAFYRPSTDTIHIPEPTRFVSPTEFYSTYYHEAVHSSGAAKRLNREFATDPKPFGSPDYGKEELIAEMGASFLCAHAGIAPAVIENQAAYLSGWLGRIREDKKLIIQAAAAGQRAADWILGQRDWDLSEKDILQPSETVGPE